MKISIGYFFCTAILIGWFTFLNVFSFFVVADESNEHEITALIQQYYELYNQLDLVSADQIVDHRLKHINENGVIQQFMLRDEVTYGTRQFQHQLKYHTDFYLHQVPSNIQIHSANDVWIATFFLLRERRLKEDDSLLEAGHFRVTWVVKNKDGKWLILHEQLSNHKE
jgi:hypothetical protein